MVVDESPPLQFKVLPIGDLSYQSKVSGHQGCQSKYFSVYWADITKENAGEKREAGLQPRNLQWMKDQVAKVVEKEQVCALPFILVFLSSFLFFFFISYFLT